eukprot:3461169-Pleurochrysis_carterae.AAC.1
MSIVDDKWVWPPGSAWRMSRVVEKPLYRAVVANREALQLPSEFMLVLVVWRDSSEKVDVVLRASRFVRDAEKLTFGTGACTTFFRRKLSLKPASMKLYITIRTA